MIKSEYIVLGAMSGTSLDGIDLALIKFNYARSWKYNFMYCETITYPKNWNHILSNLASLNDEKLNKIDLEYTHYLAQVINEFIAKNNINKIDFISSHGHTAKHLPEENITFQIGNLESLAHLTNHVVVCDFRTQDVLLNGQGAPLVPIGDKLLFNDYEFCLNLGGFANISFDFEYERRAYDICPVNIVLNYYIGKLGKNYDDKGQLAATGKTNEKLFNELNALKYYQLKHPKSLGIEWVSEFIFPLIDTYKLEIHDILKTYVAHIADQISKELNICENAEILVTGGGAYNDYLISEIKSKTINSIILPSNELIEYKEALIFGLLGVLKIRNEINCLSSVTGAIKDHSSGKIFMP